MSIFYLAAFRSLSLVMYLNARIPQLHLYHERL